MNLREVIVLCLFINVTATVVFVFAIATFYGIKLSERLRRLEIKADQNLAENEMVSTLKATGIFSPPTR